MKKTSLFDPRAAVMTLLLILGVTVVSFASPNGQNFLASLLVQEYVPPPDSGTYMPPPDSGTYMPPSGSESYVSPPPDSGTNSSSPASTTAPMGHDSCMPGDPFAGTPPCDSSQIAQMAANASTGPCGGPNEPACPDPSVMPNCACKCPQDTCSDSSKQSWFSSLPECPMCGGSEPGGGEISTTAPPPGVTGPYCGDNNCDEPNETTQNCPADCKSSFQGPFVNTDGCPVCRTSSTQAYQWSWNKPECGNMDPWKFGGLPICKDMPPDWTPPPMAVKTGCEEQENGSRVVFYSDNGDIQHDERDRCEGNTLIDNYCTPENTIDGRRTNCEFGCSYDSDGKAKCNDSAPPSYGTACPQDQYTCNGQCIPMNEPCIGGKNSPNGSVGGMDMCAGIGYDPMNCGTDYKQSCDISKKPACTSSDISKIAEYEKQCQSSPSSCGPSPVDCACKCPNDTCSNPAKQDWFNSLIQCNRCGQTEQNDYTSGNYMACPSDQYTCEGKCIPMNEPCGSSTFSKYPQQDDRYSDNNRYPAQNDKYADNKYRSQDNKYTDYNKYPAQDDKYTMPGDMYSIEDDFRMRPHGPSKCRASGDIWDESWGINKKDWYRLPKCGIKEPNIDYGMGPDMGYGVGQIPWNQPDDFFTNAMPSFGFDRNLFEIDDRINELTQFKKEITYALEEADVSELDPDLSRDFDVFISAVKKNISNYLTSLKTLKSQVEDLLSSTNKQDMQKASKLLGEFHEQGGIGEKIGSLHREFGTGMRLFLYIPQRIQHMIYDLGKNAVNNILAELKTIQVDFDKAGSYKSMNASMMAYDKVDRSLDKLEWSLGEKEFASPLKQGIKEIETILQGMGEYLAQVESEKGTEITRFARDILSEGKDRLKKIKLAFENGNYEKAGILMDKMHMMGQEAEPIIMKIAKITGIFPEFMEGPIKHKGPPREFEGDFGNNLADNWNEEDFENWDEEDWTAFEDEGKGSLFGDVSDTFDLGADDLTAALKEESSDFSKIALTLMKQNQELINKFNSLVKQNEELKKAVASTMETVSVLKEDLQNQVLTARQEILEKVASFKTETAKVIEAKVSSSAKKDLNTVQQTMSDYNFGIGEVKDKIEDEIKNLQILAASDSIDKNTLEQAIKRSRSKVEQLKEEAKNEKYKDGIIPFKDTDDDQWFTKYVHEVKNNGIVSGYKDSAGNPTGEFKPSNNVTIGEMLKIVMESTGKGQGDASKTPRSIQTGHWAAGYYQKAKDEGLSIAAEIRGPDDLNKPATRGEVIKMIMEAAKVPVPTDVEISFPDTKGNPDAYHIEKAKKLGIVSGNPDGTFLPDNPINRAEVSKIITNTIEAVIE